MIKRIFFFFVTTIAAFVMQRHLPSILAYVDSNSQLPVILGMKPTYYLIIILFMIFYEIYNYLRGKGNLVDHLNSKTEEMKSKPLSKCFIELVTKDSEDIAKCFKLITVQPIDLAWEPHLLGLKSCKQAECERWKQDDISTRLSTLRREKMISISTSLISWKTNICYAMECHLYNIIINEKKIPK